MYNDWAKSHSSLDLLNLLRKDLELLLDVECGPWEINEDNVLPMLASIDVLKESLESLPILQEESNDARHNHSP